MTDIDKLINDNTGLVRWVITKKAHDYVNDEDVYQVGMIGLWKAVKSFNESKGNKFATYAVRVIHNEILMHLRSEFSTQGKANKYAVRLDQVVDDNDNTVGSLIPNSHCDYDDVELRDQLNYIMNHLDDTDLKLIAYIREDKTQKDIARLLNVSQSHVSRLTKRLKSKVLDLVKDQPERARSVQKFLSSGSGYGSITQLNYTRTKVSTEYSKEIHPKVLPELPKDEVIVSQVRRTDEASSVVTTSTNPETLAPTMTPDSTNPKSNYKPTKVRRHKSSCNTFEVFIDRLLDAKLSTSDKSTIITQLSTKLNPLQSEYFNDYYIKNMTIEDISAKYQISISTVSRTLARARANIEDMIDNYNMIHHIVTHS